LTKSDKSQRHGKVDSNGFFEIVIPNKTLFINQNIYLSKITEPTDGMRICGDNWQAEIEGHLMDRFLPKKS
jgi:hypothetical protein